MINVESFATMVKKILHLIYILLPLFYGTKLSVRSISFQLCMSLGGQNIFCLCGERFIIKYGEK